MGLDRTRDLWIGDEPDLDRVVDLIAGLLARILNAAHEISSQSLFNQRRCQGRIQHYRRARSLSGRVSRKSLRVDQNIAWLESDFAFISVDQDVSSRLGAGRDLSRIEGGKGVADGVDPLAKSWPERPQVRPDGVRDVLSGVIHGPQGLDVQFVENLIPKLEHRFEHLRLASVNQHRRQWLTNLDRRLLACRMPRADYLEHGIHVARQRFVDAIRARNGKIGQVN